MLRWMNGIELKGYVQQYGTCTMNEDGRMRIVAVMNMCCFSKDERSKIAFLLSSEIYKLKISSPVI